MKVCLIRPPAGYSTGKKPNIKRGLYLLPQGLIYLGEALLRGGHEVEIIDIEEKQLRLKDTFDTLRQFSPDVVGLTASTPSWFFVEMTAKQIREMFPKSKIVMGGPHAMFNYQTILKKGLADVVIIGEGEYSLPTYIASVERDVTVASVPGIAYVEDDNVIYTGPSPRIDIDTWGMPAYQLLNIEAYKKVGGVSISAMRGCPYNCAFCLVPKIHNNNPLQPEPMHKPSSLSEK